METKILVICHTGNIIGGVKRQTWRILHEILKAMPQGLSALKWRWRISLSIWNQWVTHKLILEETKYQLAGASRALVSHLKLKAVRFGFAQSNNVFASRATDSQHVTQVKDTAKICIIIFNFFGNVQIIGSFKLLRFALHKALQILLCLYSASYWYHAELTLVSEYRMDIVSLSFSHFCSVAQFAYKPLNGGT